MVRDAVRRMVRCVGAHRNSGIARRERKRCAGDPQKLGGVRQNMTVVGVSPRFMFQCGRRDGNVIASPSRRT